MSDDQKFISLKEASELSGYAPDYIGQLIRQGKIAGHQRYYNIAWVTTEKAIHDYVEEINRQKGLALSQVIAQHKNKFLNTMNPLMLLNRVMWFLVVTTSVFLIFLFYIFAANIEQKLNKRVNAQTTKLNTRIIYDGTTPNN